MPIAHKTAGMWLNGTMTRLTEVHWSIVPSQTSSPYVIDVVGEIERQGVRVSRMSVRALARQKAQVVHIQWPEHVSRGPGRIRTIAKSLRAAGILAVCQSRGHRIVLTAHNLEPHLTSSRFDEWFRRRVEHLADAIVVMAHGHARELEESGVADVRRRARVIRHPMAAGQDRAPNTKRGPLVVLGLLASYHRPHDVVRALAALGSTRPVVVVGAVGEAEVLDELRALEADHAWLDLRPGFMPDDELDRLITESSAIVALQQHPFNSGAPFVAIPNGRPVVLTTSALAEDLARTIGDDWVYPLPADLESLDLTAFESFLRRERRPPDFDGYRVETVGAQHIDLYRELQAR